MSTTAETTETVTADTISRAQIKALREEARAAGDTRQVDYCDLALAAHETASEDGADLVDPFGSPITRTEARQVCADAINSGQG